MANPKLFISYAWSSQEYLDRVLKLARELSDDGIHVVIDKYDLREGQEANAFMEQMVTSEEIRKVILLCDPTYVEKANNRTGGVGTEAQIVTSEIYRQADQNKFVAVIMERDENDKVRTPVFYTSRIWIDLSRSEGYADNYLQLVRWIYDKPLHVRPEIGSMPAFLAENTRSVDLGTSTRQRRALDAVRGGTPSAVPAVAEYFDVLANSFERLRLPSGSGVEAVRKSIEDFIPYRDEFLMVVDAIASQSFADDLYDRIHRFFERIALYSDRLATLNQWQNSDFDNFRFITYEMFISTFGMAVKRENYRMAEVLSGDYYDASPDGGRDRMVSFNLFSKDVYSIEEENRRANPRHTAPLATIIKSRVNTNLLTHAHLMQGDFMLWLNAKRKGHWWYPMNCVYARSIHGAFEVFARAKSARYFDRLKIALGVNDRDHLQRIITGLVNDDRGVPRWSFDSLDVVQLSNIEQLATAP